MRGGEYEQEREASVTTCILDHNEPDYKAKFQDLRPLTLNPQPQ